MAAALRAPGESERRMTRKREQRLYALTTTHSGQEGFGKQILHTSPRAMRSQRFACTRSRRSASAMELGPPETAASTASPCKSARCTLNTLTSLFTSSSSMQRLQRFSLPMTACASSDLQWPHRERAVAVGRGCEGVSRFTTPGASSTKPSASARGTRRPSMRSLTRLEACGAPRAAQCQ